MSYRIQGAGALCWGLVGDWGKKAFGGLGPLGFAGSEALGNGTDKSLDIIPLGSAAQKTPLQRAN